MDSSTSCTHADATDQLLRRVAAWPRAKPIVCDLDETLWLRNSTEAFLDHARPVWLVAVIIAWIDAIRPWRVLRLAGWSGTQAAFLFRDWLKLGSVLLLTPWNLRRWRGYVVEQAWQDGNRPLIAALQAHGDVVVATHGFAPIAHPLAKALLPCARVYCASLWHGWLDRRRGKAAALQQRLGADWLATAMVVTDSPTHDQDLIAAAAEALVSKWPEARYEHACQSSYVPFRYTMRGKHAGRNHVVRVFLGVDFVALAFAVVPLTYSPLLTSLALLVLVLSFFIAFEVGYHENDVLGARLEANPKLTDARLANFQVMDERLAWLWAGLAGLAGIALLASADAGGSFLQVTVGWLVLLILCRALFGLFNRINEGSRAILYLTLQLLKGLGIVVAAGLPISASGAVLLLALAISRWIQYDVYRSGGKRSSTYDRLTRLLLFIVIAGGVIVHSGPASFNCWSSALIMLWLVVTARKELLAFFRQGRILK